MPCSIAKRKRDLQNKFPVGQIIPGTKLKVVTPITYPNRKGAIFGLECVCNQSPIMYRLVSAVNRINGVKACIKCRPKYGDDHPSYKGVDHKRGPHTFRAELLVKQNNLCAFPLCGKPLVSDDPKNVISVDHNHRHCPDRLADPYCIRGAVHHNCNIEITRWDWARDKGLTGIPDVVMDYLRIGDP